MYSRGRSAHPPQTRTGGANCGKELHKKETEVGERERTEGPVQAGKLEACDRNISDQLSK